MRRQSFAAGMGGRFIGHALSVLAFLVVLASGSVAHATHFRYGHYTVRAVDGNTIEFVIQNAWRRDAYSTANGRCRHPAAILVPVPCTGPGGLAGVGDVIIEFQGGTVFDPGDGSAAIGSPAGPLAYLVTSIEPADNWLFGVALDPASLPAVDDAISHTYASPGTYVAFTDSCCRISTLFGGNRHVNNPDGGYRVEIVVNVGTGNRPPVSTLSPIIPCPIDSLCIFQVPGVDPDGDLLHLRPSLPTEASSFGAFLQPGTPGSGAPNPATVSPTGLYSWDTTGATLGPAGTNTLYSTQVTIEDLDGTGNVKSKAALDFLIQLVPEDPNPPVISPPVGSPPVCETTQVLTVGVTRTFGVSASDPDADDLVTLNVVGLPVGAVMTPMLPLVGNPVASTFTWTPSAGQVGFHVIAFTASSTGGGFALCPVTVEVIESTGVAIDIKPFSDPNSINQNSQGTIPVAIISTADFDATWQVDATSLTFGRTGDEQSLWFCNSGGEDVTGDGVLDLVCHFNTVAAGFSPGDTEGVLKGQTVDGVAFEARDAVRIVGR